MLHFANIGSPQSGEGEDLLMNISVVFQEHPLPRPSGRGCGEQGCLAL